MSANQIGRPCQTAYDLCERKRSRNFVILSIPYESRGWRFRRQFGEGAASDVCEGYSWSLEPHECPPRTCGPRIGLRGGGWR
jgi:hypothetical protein